MTLRIEKMSCGSCIRHVTQALHGVAGTQADEVRLGSARVTTSASAAEIQEALGKAGYPTVVESYGEA